MRVTGNDLENQLRKAQNSISNVDKSLKTLYTYNENIGRTTNELSSLNCTPNNENAKKWLQDKLNELSKGYYSA